MDQQRFYVTSRKLFCIVIITLTSFIQNVITLYDVKLGILLPSDERLDWTLKRVVPAIEYAVENVQLQGLLPGANITMATKDSNCSETIGPLAAIDFYTEDSANLFIGPVCAYALAPVARFSPHWNIPVISAGGMATDFDNKNEYKLLTRMHVAYSDVTSLILAISHNFNWTRHGLMYHDNIKKGKGKSSCYFTVEALFFELKRKYGILPWNLKFDENDPEQFKIDDMLHQMSLNARIVVLCASADSVREIMIKAHDLNFDNGEYVFFNIDLFSSKNESKTPWKREDDTPERNEKARKAYEALMTVTLRKPTSPEYKNFSKEVKRRAKVQYENFTYGEEEVNSFVGAFHDAVILYAHALNETLAANDSIRNGTAITRKMWNRTFRGITGNVSIDSNGDRNADYSLLDMDPETGEFEVVANYFGNTKQYEPVEKKHIQWAGGREHAPPDTPTCGFDNSKCPPEEPFPNYGIVIIVLGSLLLIVLVAAFFIYRHEKLKAELKEMNWRVKWEDIMLGTIDGERGERKMKKQAASNMSLARTDDSSLESHLLIERSRSSNLSSSSHTWCKCGQCEETEPPHHRVCCRHLVKLTDRLELERCITSTKDFQDVVLNSQVLLTVYIHVMLIRKHRGSAPADLTPYKCRLMAARQFLCWVHTGEELKKETQWAVPACVIRAISSPEHKVLKRYSYTSSCSGDTIAVHLSDVGQRQLFTKTGYYKGAIVAIKPIHKSSIQVNKPLLMEVKKIKDLQNDHIVRFIGNCIDPPHMCILTEYCQKGSLQDVLENEQIKLDWMFRYSLLQDIIRGMVYLCSTDIRSHGALKSTNCVVDSRFVLKITDFGLHELRGFDEEIIEGSYPYYRSLQWTAPELLRMQMRPPNGTQKGDVYSFAIICQEIVYRKGVFYLSNLDVGPDEIIEQVKHGIRPPFRPTLEEFDCPCDELAGVIWKCWAEDPMERPDFTALKSIIRKLNKDGDKGNILDNLLSRMEQYANNLESLVEERTADFLEQKKKAEDLLYMMLPKQVAGQLIRGETVMPENFEAVTIYFSDICGFTALSAESTPYQVVDLLNDLYTTFDSCIESFDVYKVETIGDAYMVVSGLPQRNGNLHAREIARMSISLLNAVLSFRIRHKPTEQLKLRIGLHSGSVCAGVVGLKMPRYCLFGDTVNTCSRMESNGLPLRIHVSPQTHEVLQQFGTFDLELRGPVEMKGKGVVTTYWLVGERTGIIGDNKALTINR